MSNQKRKQAVIKLAAVDLDAITSKKIEELRKVLKALMYEEPTNWCLLPDWVTVSDVMTWRHSLGRINSSHSNTFLISTLFSN